ncbi:hypothetical protein HYPSUDRAFT_934307 [Hypholoma sublateritium FD-334 SS-4]|uniref:Uncharacterized protein n=1 Tax=Hypholoma sublateritium (strain FD-334 SS-4) TaxID=945553 RepID=A0A0D2P8Y2_HYPSF|nr:hypothetical protein HYPSUDRAFT_934307 [Hypholoma sublateritium FD-334 SS-4]
MVVMIQSDVKAMYERFSIFVDLRTRRVLSVHLEKLNRLDDADRIVLISFLSLLVILLLSTLLKWTRNIKRRPTLDNETMQALCAVFTPTSVAWPLLCTKFYKKTNILNDNAGRLLELDGCELFRHIYSGELEIRDARDLSLLFRRELRVYGWDICITLHRSWWLKTANWIARIYFVEVEASSRITTQGLSCRWPLSCALRIASRPRPSFDLDFVHYQDIAVEIRRIQSLHQHGNSTTIEFSCLGSAIRLVSSDFVLCAIPFLPNDENMHGQAARINRTSTPLFVKLEEIIAFLSSAEPISIKSIENISSEHAATLHELEQELVYNKNLRNEHIKDVSLEGWRKDRFMLAWEAGLLMAKKLVRWRITIGN